MLYSFARKTVGISLDNSHIGLSLDILSKTRIYNSKSRYLCLSKTKTCITKKSGISLNFGLSNLVYAGFRDSRQNIQDPPSVQSDPAADPDPHYEEHMEARHDQEELEEAIINFLLLLEKQEKKGFKDFKAWPHIIPVAQACTRFCSLHVSVRRGRGRLKTRLSTNCGLRSRQLEYVHSVGGSELPLYQHA